MTDSPDTEALRAEVDERQAFVAAKLSEAGIDQLVLMEPPNLAWFSGASLAHSILDPAEQPCLIISATARTVVCSNVDSQRLFDSFLDRLGFQLKEWPWSAGREQLLADLCENRTIACDRAIRSAAPWAEALRMTRLTFSPRVQDGLRSLGRDLAHALEATCRNIDQGQNELEVVGHIGHRMMRHELEPIAVHAAADRRIANDLRPTNGVAEVGASCTITATARRDGLHATAARTVWFGPPFEDFRAEIDAASPIAAATISALRGGTSVAAVFDAGQKLASGLQREHAWHDTPMGWRTGRLPIEGLLVPMSDHPVLPNQAIVLQTRLGAALFLDTFLITPSEAECLTSPDEWPVRRFRLPDSTIDVPDVLIR